MTVNLPLASFTRLPFALACNPSLAARTPGLVTSSIKTPIRSLSSLLGGTPASLAEWALSIPRIRMVVSPDGLGFEPRSRPNGVRARRCGHVDGARDRHAEQFFVF